MKVRDLIARAARIADYSDEFRRPLDLCQIHLALGNYNDAARLYREHAGRQISDYSGYSLCLSALASRLAGDTKIAVETLKEAATMEGDSDWPRLAIQFVNGDISEDEFRHSPERTTVTPFKRSSRECEVNCILGLVKESKRDMPGALAAYQASLATKSIGDVEFFIAKHAVQRLQTTGK